MIRAAVLSGCLLVGSACSAADAAQPTGCLPATLRVALSKIRSMAGSVTIVSTNRPGARIAGSGRPSLHASCRAVDFHVPPRSRGRVLAWLRASWPGGVGTYSGGMHHIHIDNGSRVRFHHRVGWPRR